MSGARVTELVRYPIKGCAGERLDDVPVHPMGLADDRLFMVVDRTGKFMSQRKRPLMAVIRPTLLGDRLALAAPGVEDLVLDVTVDGPLTEVTVFKWAGKAVDQGTVAAEWFSAVIGEPVRLVRVPPGHHRPSHGETGGEVGFADGTALLLTSTSSLVDLNSRIAGAGADPVPMSRFRANIVVTGWAEPFAEDRIRQFSVGGLEAGFEVVAVRCAVPTVDQETGMKTGLEPTRTLATYRRNSDGVIFGIRAAVVTPGRIAVGDPVVVRDWA